MSRRRLITMAGVSAGSTLLTPQTLLAEGMPRAYRGKFSGKFEHRSITGGVGHTLPQEAPQAFAKAVIDVDHF